MCVHVFLPSLFPSWLLQRLLGYETLWAIWAIRSRKSWWRRWLLRANDFSLPSFFGYFRAVVPMEDC